MKQRVALFVEQFSQGKVEYTDFKLYYSTEDGSVPFGRPTVTVSYPGRVFDRVFVEEVAREMDVELLPGVEKREIDGWLTRREIYRGWRDLEASA